jgi:hypothetical protein
MTQNPMDRPHFVNFREFLVFHRFNRRDPSLFNRVILCELSRDPTQTLALGQSHDSTTDHSVDPGEPGDRYPAQRTDGRPLDSQPPSSHNLERSTISSQQSVIAFKRTCLSCVRFVFSRLCLEKAINRIARNPREGSTTKSVFSRTKDTLASRVYMLCPLRSSIPN